MPPSPKALADLLRNYILRIGRDWQDKAKVYDRRVRERNDFKEEFLIEIERGVSLNVNLDGLNYKAINCENKIFNKGTQHKRIFDLYLHWRSKAGLGPERDMFSGSEEGDREAPLFAPLPRAVLAHNLRSAYNVGSIFRTADCFGFSDVNLSGYTPDIEHPALKSAARGAEIWIKSKRWESPLDCIAFYKDNGYSIIALETDGEDIKNFKFPEKILFVVGNEELGIANELLNECDFKVSIQMRGRKASLNVSSAFAALASWV